MSSRTIVTESKNAAVPTRHRSRLVDDMTRAALLRPMRFRNPEDPQRCGRTSCSLA
jgi:hypothetical protein